MELSRVTGGEIPEIIETPIPIDRKYSVAIIENSPFLQPFARIEESNAYYPLNHANFNRIAALPNGPSLECNNFSDEKSFILFENLTKLSNEYTKLKIY